MKMKYLIMINSSESYALRMNNHHRMQRMEQKAIGWDENNDEHMKFYAY